MIKEETTRLINLFFSPKLPCGSDPIIFGYLRIITLKFDEAIFFKYFSIFNLYFEYGDGLNLNLFLSKTDNELENIKSFYFSIFQITNKFHFEIYNYY